MLISSKKSVLTVMVTAATALMLSGCISNIMPGSAPKTNTNDLTAEESRQMSCEDIRQNIKDLKDYISYYDDAESILGMFTDKKMAASRNLVNQANLRLRKIEDLQVIKKCK